MRVQVFVRLKTGVLDVQGKAVEHGFVRLGYRGVGNVRIGRLIEFDLEEDDPKKARGAADELCQKLLANPIIESYEIKTA
jgi:phosphoribosylformylglycinamidine synthase